MPSTYTTNTGIEKPGSGEQSGTWGTTVNTNMDILDRALNGVVSIALSGTSSTLTTTDGLLSDGMYKLLVLGGSPSGTHTITVAPADAQKIYFVRNTSGQSVVFTQGSGAATVTVLNGTSAIIYADGSDECRSVSETFALSQLYLNGTAVTATASELNTLDGITASTAELNIMDGVTATTAELNTLGGINTTGNFGLVPPGGIILWSGAIVDIPSGWYLCDGNNGTPNLRDRFVIGAGSTYGVGVTGGASSVTLTSANIPAHTHSFSGTTDSGGGHSHSASTGSSGNHRHSVASGNTSDGVVRGFADNYSPNGVGAVPYGNITGYYDTFPSSGAQVLSNAGDHTHTVTINSGGSHTHTFSGTTGSYGSGTAFSALPPYYALAYIMKA